MLKSILTDIAKFGGPVVSVLEIVENVSGVSGNEQLVIAAVVAGITGVVSFINQHVLAAKAAKKA